MIDWKIENNTTYGYVGSELMVSIGQHGSSETEGYYIASHNFGFYKGLGRLEFDDDLSRLKSKCERKFKQHLLNLMSESDLLSKHKIIEYPKNTFIHLIERIYDASIIMSRELNCRARDLVVYISPFVSKMICESITHEKYHYISNSHSFEKGIITQLQGFDVKEGYDDRVVVVKLKRECGELRSICTYIDVESKQMSHTFKVTQL